MGAIKRVACCRECAWIVLAAVALVSILWYFTAERIMHEREESVASAVKSNENLALALEEQSVRALKAAEQVLLFMRHEYQEHGQVISLAKLHKGGLAETSIFASAFVVDERGDMVQAERGETSPSFADRDFFAHHRDAADTETHIGVPIKGRLTGRAVIPVTLRLSKADGSFGGVYVIGIGADYFIRSFERFDVGSKGVIQLVRSDGVALARRIGDHLAFGESRPDTGLMRTVAASPVGSFVTSGRQDGNARFQSYRKLQGYPLIVAVGTAVDETLAEFSARERSYYLAAGGVSLVLAAFAVALLLATRRRARAMDALKESQAQFTQLADNVPEAFWIRDAGSPDPVYISPAFEAITGRSRRLFGSWREWKGMIHLADAAKAVPAYRAMGSGRVDIEHRIVRDDDTVRWVHVEGFPVHDEHGAVVRIVGMIRDVTASRSAAEAIGKAEARYRATFEQGAVGIAHAALDGRFISANPKFCRMLGYDQAELLGRAFEDVTHPEDLGVSRESKARLVAAATDAIPEYEKRYICKDGSIVWVSIAISLVRKPDGAPDYFIAMVTDISARKRAEEMVVYQAHYDALTELPNRTLFQDRLTQALTQARRHSWTAAVITVDLDRFHAVNDTLGHAIGDRVLQEVAKRLAASVRGGDTVARIGGDGFAVIATDLARAQDAGLVAQKIVDAVARPFLIDGHEVYVGASAGVAAFPADGEAVAVLMKNADAAMQHAKQLGRNNYRFYAAAMNERAMDKLLLENDLRRALERDEFRMHLQPKADLKTGRVCSFEALLRWQRPGNGLVPPGQFVPVLEETGLIIGVGEWIIRAACAQLAAWKRDGLEPMPIAVNLAAKQFGGGDLVATVERALAEHGVAPGLLELEITEGDAMQSPEAGMLILRALKERGVRIAIDDFGTGYSSLSYLKRFPVDTLKLDRSFVSGLPQQGDDVSIALAVITMAHSLGLKVVAEGVETAAQRDFLRAHGCDQMQGYFLSRPVPAAEAGRFLVDEHQPLSVAAA